MNTSSRRIHPCAPRSPTFISFVPDDDLAPSVPKPAATNSRKHRFSPVRQPKRDHQQRPHQQQQQQEEEEMEKESLLVQCCRNRDWKKALKLCESHPEMAAPQRLVRAAPDTTIQPFKRTASSSSSSRPTSFHYNDQHDLFEDTALGIICRSTFDNKNEICNLLRLIEALLDANKEQLHASQLVRGHTPLRDAICNPRCTKEMLELLLKADEGFHTTFLQDGNGLSPVDHLIMNLVHSQGRFRSRNSQELFRVYVDIVEVRLAQNAPTTSSTALSSSSHSSPLLRLLSLHDSQNRSESLYYHYYGADGDGSFMSSDNRVRRILDNARYLIQKNPSRLYEKSKTSSCTALHVALRNYGNYREVVEFLFDQDDKKDNNKLVTERNVFGDLPLHVACLVGVPMDILRLVLDKTLTAAAAATHPHEPGRAHPLLWSSNHSGRTPVDLEWMRHIEGGKGLSESRSFYPLEERGILFQNGRLEDMYRNLLRDAVLQAMATKRFGHSGSAELNPAKAIDVCFGTLISRILLLVQMAYRGCPTEDLVHGNEVTTDYLLHAASTLTNSSGPTLPEPLLNLFAFLHSDQISIRDCHGRLPLHCALIPTNSSTLPFHHSFSEQTQPDSAAEHQRWVLKLLKQHPAASHLADSKLRLPIQYSLDHTTAPSSSSSCMTKTKNCRSYVSLFWNQQEPEKASDSTSQQQLILIKELVDAYPDSVERRDPTTGLYPFQQAASNKSMKLDVLFLLLQRAPTLLIADGGPKGEASP